MRVFGLLFIPLLMVGCSTLGETPRQGSAPDIDATVRASVAAALPTSTPTPTPDLKATVQAAVAAALPTETPVKPPDISATVEARMAATAAAIPTDTPSPTPTSLPTPTHTPSPTPTPLPTPTPSPTPTPLPTPTHTPTPTPSPSPEPSEALALAVSEMVKLVRPSVVKISHGAGLGSGVIFDTEGRTANIVTNAHVVHGHTQVTVTVDDSTTYLGAVIGTDSTRDLAVVQICCGTFTSVGFGDASKLSPGDEVVAIGYARGDEIQGAATVTKGIVSAIRYTDWYRAEVIQTDTPINPGNSGGPLLSLGGLIMGINTSGFSDAEGLNFAISEETVQERIPYLLGGGDPDPTPTRTSVPDSSNDFGPIGGELRHEPADDLIVTEYAEVSIADMVVEATFINPYAASDDPWDYGFILRQAGDEPFLQFMVTSNRRWAAVTRAGPFDPFDQIAAGTWQNLDVDSGGRNHLMVVAIGGRGWFFVNGGFVTTVDLSSVTHSGDVAVITGAYIGDEVAGAVTRYEDFQGYALKRRYGPSDGELVREKEGIVSEHESGVQIRDLVVEAHFINPPAENWDYGFIIRNPRSNRLEVIAFRDDARWFHESRDIGDEGYTTVASGRFSIPQTTPSRRNHLLLIAVGDTGWLFIDEELISSLDLGHNQDEGDVGAIANFWNNHRAKVEFYDFTVWAPD